MLPSNILNSLVTIKRRVSTGTDSLGNPIYGNPTLGVGWSTIFNNVPVRLAFGSKPIQFSPEGERITPNGVMYYNGGYNIIPEDRVLTANGIEYVVVSVVAGYVFGSVVDHYEAVLALP